YFNTTTFTGGTKMSTADREAALKKLEDESDYVYVGGDLKNGPADLAKDIWGSASKTTVEGESYALGVSGGTSRFMSIGEVAPAKKAWKGGRGKMGLGPVPMPEVVANAIKEEEASHGR